MAYPARPGSLLPDKSRFDLAKRARSPALGSRLEPLALGRIVGYADRWKGTGWALSVQVGERAADKIVFSVAKLTGNIWMMENISE